MDLVISAFLGYVLGRTGHKYLNVWVGDPVWIPHHWIFGAALMMGGIFLGWPVFSFGLGLVISDLDDFSEWRFFSKDGPGPKKFWGID